MKKIIVGLFVLGTLFTVVQGNLLDKVQKIDVMIQSKKFIQAENYAKRLLLDPNITPEERASIQNLLNEISKRKLESQQGDIQNIVVENNEEKVEEEEAESENILTTMEDISDGSKFKTYDEYEAAAIATKNPDTIFKMANLYFRDGLYQRAVHVAKKDKSGSIQNLYVVAIGSRLIGNYEQSIDYYNRILSKNPREYEARLGRGIAYKSIGEFDKALSDLRAYASVNGNSEVNNAIRELNNIISNK